MLLINYSLPKIEMLLITEEQVDLGMVSTRKGIVDLVFFYLWREVPSHPLCEFEIVLILCLRQFLDLG